MKSPRLQICLLDSNIDRHKFDSGVDALDLYLSNQASQDIKRRIAACFVALDDDLRVAGYYTLASASVFLNDLSPALIKKLPRYPSIPAVRLGRLAVDQRFQGHGLGAALLADALRRAVMAEIAAYAMLVDAKDETAASFYQHHGFRAIESNPFCLYLPLATVKDLVTKKSGGLRQ